MALRRAPWRVPPPGAGHPGLEEAGCGWYLCVRTDDPGRGRSDRMAPAATILVIDDEPSVVSVLARLLQRDGYRVETARNGRDALVALQGQRYDVILCDLRMPELDGRALYAHLRYRAPTLCRRVIFLTGDSRAPDHQAFLAQC